MFFLFLEYRFYLKSPCFLETEGIIKSDEQIFQRIERNETDKFQKQNLPKVSGSK